MIRVKRQLHLGKGQRGQQKIATKPPVVVSGRVPRISRLMALAIRFEGLLRDGIVCDQSELARLGHVTQPRMTQIMALLNLAPDIQEESVTTIPPSLILLFSIGCLLRLESELPQTHPMDRKI